MKWPWKRVIPTCNDVKSPLLTRYHLVWTKRFGVYAHHLHCSDEDRALHDHPWAFVTFLFHRGYWEHTTEGRMWRPRWSILFRPAKFQHRLELEGPTWTFVIRLRYQRIWGFWFNGKFTNYLQYGRDFCE